MWYLNSTINGLLTLIPITVGINQIILSQELNSISEFYERFDNTVTFRRQVEDLTGTTVSSPQASEFCYHLFIALQQEAESFTDTCASNDDSELRHAATKYATTVGNQAGQMATVMNRLEYNISDTFLALLDFQDTEQFHQTYSLQSKYVKTILEDASESLDRIQELFKDIDTIREYLKTLTIQRELARLSTMLLSTGLLAIVIAGLAIFRYRSMPGFTLTSPVFTIIAAAVFAISISLLAFLVSYVLRVATIARRTAAFGLFLTPEERQRSEKYREADEK
jgi:cadmium resistance protein CadD (predicted permease)